MAVVTALQITSSIITHHISPISLVTVLEVSIPFCLLSESSVWSDLTHQSSRQWVGVDLHQSALSWPFDNHRVCKWSQQVASKSCLSALCATCAASVAFAVFSLVRAAEVVVLSTDLVTVRFGRCDSCHWLGSLSVEWCSPIRALRPLCQVGVCVSLLTEL